MGLLDHLKETTLQYFEVLDTYIYDETLDFRGRASQWVAREGIFEFAEGEVPKDWVFIIWNRSSLQEANWNNRPMQVTANFEDPSTSDQANATTNMRMASLDVEIKIVTNNIGIAEQIEEHLYVNTGEFLVFDADYGENGIFNLSAQPSTTTTFEKEDLVELGPVMAVGLQVNINFPVIMPLKQASVIEIINYKLWQYPVETPSLIREETITG